MDNKTGHLDNLAEIRSIMERSSRFISLSGLSGVFAGVFALLGGLAAMYYVNIHQSSFSSYEQTDPSFISLNLNYLLFFIVDASFVLFASISTGLYLTYRRSKKNNKSMWDSIAKRMLMNLCIPLITGGIFCIALIYHGAFVLIAPATLIFYGLALINGSKYTLNDIRYLGVLEIVLGLIACFFLGYGLIFWMIGFGLLHIIYGILMYNKYER